MGSAAACETTHCRIISTEKKKSVLEPFPYSEWIMRNLGTLLSSLFSSLFFNY